MKILYFDCFSGISGDMVIGALIDAGADPNVLVEELKKLPIHDEYDLKWKKVVKNGITSTKFDVLLKKDPSHFHTHDLEAHSATPSQNGHSHDHADGHLSHEAGHTHHHSP